MTTPLPPGSGAASSLPDQTTGIHGLLDVETVEASPERVVLRLPVDWRVHQPYGILHGGVSALLAESAASFGGALNAGPDKGVVGIELNASHLRSLRDGHLTAEATPIRVGRTIQVWRIAPDRRRRPRHLRGALHAGRRGHAPRGWRSGPGTRRLGGIESPPDTGVLCRCDPGRKWSAASDARADPPPHHAGRTRRARR